MMKRLGNFRRLAVVAIVAAASSTAALATTISYQADVFSPFPGNQQQTSWSQNVNLPRFNVFAAPPGFTYVLDAVTITLNWATTGEIDVYNSSTVAHGFINASSSIPLAATGPGGLLVNTNAVSGPISSATSTATTCYNGVLQSFVACVPGGGVPPGSSGLQPGAAFYTGIQNTGSTSSASNGIPGFSILSYSGGGNVNLSFNVTAGDGTYGGTETGGSGHLSFGGNALADAQVVITYDYHLAAVPEPVTLALTGSALLGLAVALRRRRAV